MRSSVVRASGPGSFTDGPHGPRGYLWEPADGAPHFRPSRGHRLKSARVGGGVILTAQEVGHLFDADTRDAMASGLCLRCRGAKLLCGKERCPIVVQYDSMMRTRPLIDSTALDGSSPPGVFVGRFGYPQGSVGPL